MNRIVFAFAALLTFGSAAAQTQAPEPAVVVHADAGAVQVQGAPVAAETSAGANAGDLVSVDAGGSATVTYANGCAVQVTDRYQILDTEPTCDTGMVPAANDGLLVAGGIAAGVLVIAAVAGGGGSDTPSSP